MIFDDICHFDTFRLNPAYDFDSWLHLQPPQLPSIAHLIPQTLSRSLKAAFFRRFL